MIFIIYSTHVIPKPYDCLSAVEHKTRNCTGYFSMQLWWMGIRARAPQK